MNIKILVLTFTLITLSIQSICAGIIEVENLDKMGATVAKKFDGKAIKAFADYDSATNLVKSVQVTVQKPPTNMVETVTLRNIDLRCQETTPSSPELYVGTIKNPQASKGAGAGAQMKECTLSLGTIFAP